MFKSEEVTPFVYENFVCGNVAIGEAGIGDMFELGGHAKNFPPDNTSYQNCVKTAYQYGWDYTILTVNNIIQGYFIGDMGYNNVATPHTTQGDLVYELFEIWLNIGYDDGQEPTEFYLLFDYLIRHAKQNKCKLLQLRIDEQNRYQLFYQHVKQKYAMQQWDNYLIKQIG